MVTAHTVLVCAQQQSKHNFSLLYNYSLSDASLGGCFVLSGVGEVICFLEVAVISVMFCGHVSSLQSTRLGEMLKVTAKKNKTKLGVEESSCSSSKSSRTSRTSKTSRTGKSGNSSNSQLSFILSLLLYLCYYIFVTLSLFLCYSVSIYPVSFYLSPFPVPVPLLFCLLLSCLHPLFPVPVPLLFCLLLPCLHPFVPLLPCPLLPCPCLVILSTGQC